METTIWGLGYRALRVLGILGVMKGYLKVI